jgi:hypothetical protein
MAEQEVLCDSKEIPLVDLIRMLHTSNSFLRPVYC